MSANRISRVLWLAGLIVLAAAHATHAYEHWEIAAHQECVAHAHADGDDHEGGSRHDHGCAAHDHAPALTGGIFLLTFTEAVTVVSPVCLVAPAPRASSIDHPPQLS
jgi:hypothetical protein